MKHVDDGLLHAYLDGAFAPTDPQHVRITAHLTTCTACRARLEEEQALREEASRIVGDLGPHRPIVAPWEVTAPPPTVSPAPAPARPHAPVSSSMRFRLPLAWAATFLLALGAGWTTRELWMPAAPVANGRDAPAAPTVVATAPATNAEEAATRSAQEDHAARIQIVDRARSATGPERASAAAAPPPPVEPPVPVVTPSLAAAAEPSLREPPAARPIHSVRAPQPRLASAAQPEAAGAAPRARGEDRRVSGPRPAERTVAGPLPDLPHGEPRVAAPRGRARPPLRQPSRGTPPPGPASSRNRAPVRTPEPGWSPVSQAEAERRLGAPLAQVEGLPLSGLWIAEEDSSWRVRTVQETEAGIGLELLQWRQPAGTDQSAADEAAENARTGQVESGEPRVLQAGDAGGGRSTVLLALPSGKSLLSLSAPLPLDSLLSLVPRVKELKP